jgi:hypothetical protein
VLAYAAALGAAPAAVAVFTPGGTDVAWSSYRGSWQQIEIETNTWPWPRALLIMVAIIFGPVLYFIAAIWLGTHGMAALAEELVGLTVAAAIGGAVVWLARRTLFPRFAEFDGQVIRQWVIKGGDDSPDQYHVAIDDGARVKAWDLETGSEPYRLLTPARAEDRCAYHGTPVGQPDCGANGMARSRSGGRLSARRQGCAARGSADRDHQHPRHPSRRERSVADRPAPAGRSAAPRVRGPAVARVRLRGLKPASFGLIDFNQY